MNFPVDEYINRTWISPFYKAGFVFYKLCGKKRNIKFFITLFNFDQPGSPVSSYFYWCLQCKQNCVYIVVVQSLSCVWLFATPWTAAHQASLSITNSRSLLKLMSIILVMPSNHLIFCCPLLLPSIFPNIKSFLMSQFFTSGGPSIGALTSVFSVNIQGWFPLGWTGWISLQSKGLSRVFSTSQLKNISSSVLSFL